MDEAPERVRLDRWLWAARFVKNRPLAVEAISGGHVQVNGRRVKPSKEVGPGDRLEITLQRSRRIVVVSAVAHRRGPAGQAALLYEETPESIAAAADDAAAARLSPAPEAQLGARPTKRDRRRIDAARRRG